MSILNTHKNSATKLQNFLKCFNCFLIKNLSTLSNYVSETKNSKNSEHFPGSLERKSLTCGLYLSELKSSMMSTPRVAALAGSGCSRPYIKIHIC